MCNVCADNAAAFYVKMPNSRCAKLVLQALGLRPPTSPPLCRSCHDCRRVFAPFPAGTQESIARRIVIPPGTACGPGGNCGTTEETGVMFVGVVARALWGWSLISPIKTWSDPSPGEAAAALVSVQACP